MAIYNLIYQDKQTETEHGHKVLYTRKVYRFELRGIIYQKESFYRNGQLINSHSYPAYTDYALSRIVN